MITKKKHSLKLDTLVTPIIARSIDEFNEYVYKYKPLAPYTISLTKGGNISQQNLWNMPCCKTWKRDNRYEFHYITGLEHIRVIYSIAQDEESGKDIKIALDALNYFGQKLMDVIPDDDHEEDTELFTCEENKNSAYYNYVNDYWLDTTINHCYSLDRNNSFMASMKEVYPQTAKWVDNYYEERLRRKGTEGYDNFKLYGSIFVGWLKKKNRSHAWKKIISNSNRKVDELRRYIEEQGNTVLLVNTDAVKFIGHVDYEGTTELGGFKYEWQDCKMYIKGVKSYAYEENGKWNFKQAGACKLDRVKPRDQWTLEEWKSKDTRVEHIIVESDLLVRRYY